MHSDPDDLLALLKWRFSRVAYRASEGAYVINGGIILSDAQARRLAEGRAGLEEVVCHSSFRSHAAGANRASTLVE